MDRPEFESRPSEMDLPTRSGQCEDEGRWVRIQAEVNGKRIVGTVVNDGDRSGDLRKNRKLKKKVRRYG